MEFSNCNDVLNFLKNNYCKLLIVNLKENTYCPKIIADDEVTALGTRLDYVFSNYTDWFCSSDFVHPDDKDGLKLFFEKPRAGQSFIYRRKLQGDYHRVLMILQPTVTENEVLLYVRDIEDIYNDERERIIETDEMTQLYNRHAFFRDVRANEGNRVGVIYADSRITNCNNHQTGHLLCIR